MAKFQDLTGKRFGKLIVIERTKSKSKSNRTYWKCKCDCGNYKDVASCHLKSGTVKSCGCIRKNIISNLNKKHGKSNTRIFRAYIHMKDRCYRNTDKRYKNYGARGIKICDEWLDKENGFINFYKWAIENGYKDGLTIDRIDVNGNYEPNNCRWVDMKTQANNKSNNHLITYKNETHTLAEWSEILNIKYRTLQMRLIRNWTIDKAFSKK